jgi:hypothetical protein
MRRRHNHYMHGWGIAEGLLVQRNGERQILVTPGMAIEREGREIVLVEARTVNVGPLEKAGHVYAVTSYREEGANQQSESGQLPNYTRMVEMAVISITHQRPPNDGAAVALARIYLDDAGRITEIDGSVRRDARMRRQHGWVRMSFKPHPMHDKPAFHVGPTEARSEEAGAWGTMGVPAPPGADRVTGFRIAGEWNDGEIIVNLFRSGWDPNKKQHEREYILKDEKLIGGRPYRRRDDVPREVNPFERPFDLDCELDRGHHALAVLVHATAGASISLIAVRFEYDLREYERRQLWSGR